jgi:hypothetical protein
MAPGEVFSSWPIGLPFEGILPGRSYKATEGRSLSTPLWSGAAELLKQAAGCRMRPHKARCRPRWGLAASHRLPRAQLRRGPQDSALPS